MNKKQDFYIHLEKNIANGCREDFPLFTSGSLPWKFCSRPFFLFFIYLYTLRTYKYVIFSFNHYCR